MINQEFYTILEQASLYGFEVSPKILDSFQTRSIPLKHSGVASRIFLSWKEGGLVTGFDPPEGREREHALLSIPEYLWVKMIQQLRAFGFSYPQLLELKKWLFAEISIEEYVSAELAKKGITDPEQKKRFVEEQTKALNLTTLLPSENAGGALTHLILSMLCSGSEIDMHILESGYALTVLNGKVVSEPSEKYRYEPYIRLSLNKLYFEMLVEPSLTEYVERYELFSEDEMQVIKTMRSGNIRNLEIKFTDSGKPLRMEWTEYRQVTQADFRAFANSVKMNPYEELSFTTNNNKSYTVKRTLKKKLGTS